MDNNGTFFSTIIALVTGVVLGTLLFGVIWIVAGVILVLWALFAVAYWINALMQRKAGDSNTSPEGP